MKYVILAMLLYVTLAHAEVEVYQVLYDPVGSESGGEAVELKNTGDESVDLSAWILATDSSNHDATLPQNTILLPGRTFLIADERWDENKDNASWRKADYLEIITLGNTNGFVALLNGNQTIDAVSWGGDSSVGISGPSVSPGMALRRNGEAFEEAPADFFEGIPVVLTAEVTLRIPMLEITPFVNLAPEGTLSLRNSGPNAVTVSLRISGLAYKNYTLPSDTVEIEGPLTFTIAPKGEYRANMKLHVPPKTVPGKYRSTLRVTIFDS